MKLDDANQCTSADSDHMLMHKSFVITGPTYGEGWGIAGLKCGAITFRVSLQCRGNDRVLILGSLPKRDFVLLRVGQRASFDLQFAPCGWGL